MLSEGGVDDLPTLRLLRRVAHDLTSAGSPHSYLIACGNEIVGLCGYKHPPRPDGSVEIGFGIAVARRNRGYATAAVALLLARARRDPCVATVVAETRTYNLASQSVLRRNGFAIWGGRSDDVEGELILWRAAPAG